MPELTVHVLLVSTGPYDTTFAAVAVYISAEDAERGCAEATQELEALTSWRCPVCNQTRSEHTEEARERLRHLAATHWSPDRAHYLDHMACDASPPMASKFPLAEAILFDHGGEFYFTVEAVPARGPGWLPLSVLLPALGR